jgi:hypothetical protein
MRLIRIIYRVIILIVGAFLAVDGFIIHRIFYQYPNSISWLDPYINHGYWGIILIILTIVDIFSWERKNIK